MSEKLTVLIPCKDEIANIAACVDSVRDLADEILVADSGSTDGTLEWVQTDPDCRVIRREFIDSGDFKNWAIPQARHRWVLIVDADERITPELANEVRRCLNDAPKHHAFAISRHNHFMGHPVRYTSWGRDQVVRLIRRDRCRYRLHTDHSEIDLPASRVGHLQAKMVHFTCWDYDRYLRKIMRYTEQQAELWYQQGRRPSAMKMLTTGPLRFVRCYVINLGFLDGVVGLQVAMLTGFYSFLKQAKLWRRWHGKRLTDLETPAVPREPPETLADVA